MTVEGLEAFSALQIEPTEALQSKLEAVESKLSADDNINIQFTSGYDGKSERRNVNAPKHSK